MQIHFNPKEFLCKFRLAASVAPSKDVVPILQNVKIVACKKHGTVLMATDTELGIRVAVDCNVSKNGAALLPVKRLLKMLPLFKDESVTMESSKTGIVLYGDSKRVELESGNPDEFPDVVEFSETVSCTMPACLLQKAIRRTAFAVDMNHGQFPSGVCFQSDGHYVEVVATDGCRFAWQRVETKLRRFKNSIIPLATISILEHILKDKSICGIDRVKIAFKNDSVVIQCSHITLYSRLCVSENNSSFSHWESVIPDECNMLHGIVQCGELLGAVRRAMIMTGKENPVRFEVDNERLVVVGRCPEAGTAKITVPIGFTGQATFAVSPIQMIDLLSSFDKSTKLSLYFPTEENKPAMIRTQDDYCYVVMPSKVAEMEQPDADMGVEIVGEFQPKEEPMDESIEKPGDSDSDREMETKLLSLMSENDQLQAKVEHYKSLLERSMLVIEKMKRDQRCIA